MDLTSDLSGESGYEFIDSGIDGTISANGTTSDGKHYGHQHRHHHKKQINSVHVDIVMQNIVIDQHLFETPFQSAIAETDCTVLIVATHDFNLITAASHIVGWNVSCDRLDALYMK